VDLQLIIHGAAYYFHSDT